MAYSEIFSIWKKTYSSEWDNYINHNFVSKIADGTLSQEVFIHYLKQDYRFLMHFSRAWGLAIAKSQNLYEMEMCSKVVYALLNTEMELHVKYCAKYGVPKADLEKTEEAPQNLAYTRYVMDSGYSGDFLDLVAALTPCVLGYGEIGKSLSARNTSAVYKDWISTYSGEEYQTLCLEIGIMLDKAVMTRLGDYFEKIGKFRELSERFKVATILETNFWEMTKV
tara:strand:- start:1592 stop:2260 length:669 start_codon:yes stop_codon:yes gene_type:complete